MELLLHLVQNAPRLQGMATRKAHRGPRQRGRAAQTAKCGERFRPLQTQLPPQPGASSSNQPSDPRYPPALKRGWGRRGGASASAPSASAPSGVVAASKRWTPPQKGF